MKPVYKRRQYIVDPAYQIRFVTRVFLTIFGIAALSSLMATFLILTNMQHPDMDGTDPALAASLIAVATTLLIELLLAIPIAYIFGIRTTHRIVGPVKRLKKTLEAIGEGDFSQQIVLREGDVLQDVAEAINQMAERLRQRYPSSR